MRSRIIRQGFFENEILGSIDPLASILFIGLRCAADRNGRFEWRPKRLKAQILPYRTVDIEKLLNLLVSTGFIDRYQVGDAVIGSVINFNKYQSINKHEAASSLPGPDNAYASTCIHMQSDHREQVEVEVEVKEEVKVKKDLLRIGPHFTCTQDQRDTLAAEDGEEAFLARVETINDYCAAHGKRYKDYPAAYRQFRKRDQDRTPIVTGGSPGVFKSAREKQLEREAAALETVGLFFDDLERDKAEQKKLNGGKNDQRRISHHS